MSNLLNTSEYRNWLESLKAKIKSSQIRASLSVNREVILLYWDLGKQILEKQNINGWGSRVVSQLSQDLSNEFQGVTGFSRSNLYAMKQFYEFFHQLGGKIGETENEIVHQVGGQLAADDNLPEIVEKYCPQRYL
jgi:predicted nuclease of restriction endonuclease-like (RecB) superfamily